MNEDAEERLLDLVGLAEIRELLGDVSRQRADTLTRYAGFPKPVASLSKGRLWWRAEVIAWLKDNGRL